MTHVQVQDCTEYPLVFYNLTAYAFQYITNTVTHIQNIKSENDSRRTKHG